MLFVLFIIYYTSRDVLLKLLKKTKEGERKCERQTSSGWKIIKYRTEAKRI